nr:unnamed protein product [Callosobruchus analis]
MVSTDCVIHRQALAFKNLPQKLRQNVDSAIKIVNYIKSSALNSRISILITKFFCCIRMLGIQRLAFMN